MNPYHHPPPPYGAYPPPPPGVPHHAASRYLPPVHGMIPPGMFPTTNIPPGIVLRPSMHNTKIYSPLPPPPPPTTVVMGNPSGSNGNSHLLTPNASVASTMVTSNVITPPQPLQPTIKPTIYVGKIPEIVEDDYIQKLLNLCGTVVKWNRASEPGGKLKGFGFAEYSSPDGVTRAMRLLNDLSPTGEQDKKLMLKVEDKVQQFINEHYQQQDQEQNSNQEERQKQDQEQDETVKIQIDELLQEVQQKLSIKLAQQALLKPPPTASELLEAKSNETNLKLLTKDEKLKLAQKEKEKEQERERETERRRKERLERDFREMEREWEFRERDRERDRERSKDREYNRDKTEIMLRKQEMDNFNDDDERMRSKLRSRDELKRRQREREDDRRDRERERELEEQIKSKAQQLAQETKIQFDLSSKKGKLAVASGFNSTLQADEPEQQIKKKQLIPLDYSEISLSMTNNEITVNLKPTPNKLPPPPPSTSSSSSIIVENNINNNNTNSNSNNNLKSSTSSQPTTALSKEQIQKIFDSIPNDKEGLLKQTVDWDLMDKHAIVDTKLKPWITKKLTEIVGVEEKVLIDHIVAMLNRRSDPNSIIKQLDMIDKEAETFVLKMWKMLLFHLKTIE